MKLRKLVLVLLIALTSIVAIDMTSVEASSATKLVVHYHRYDNDYSDWNLWLWPSGSDGGDYNFNGTDSFGTKAEITLSSTNLNGSDSIGILIKDSNWTKDIEYDRFIDMTNPNGAGEVHVYFVQGEEYYSYVSVDQAGCDENNPDPQLCAVDLFSGLIDVYINESMNLEFVATESVSASDITVYEEGTPITFTGFTSGASGTLTLNSSVNTSKSYTIAVNIAGEITTSVVRFAFDYDSTAFANAYHYTGTLGYEYSSTETTFKLWAPVSSEVEVNLYTKGHTTASRNDGVNSPYATIDMEYLEKGVWAVTVDGDLDGVYYTFNVVNFGTKVHEIQDPYGVSFGLNGLRSMVLDLDATDPEGWDQDAGVNGYTSATDAIIYELHVRDLTSAESWGGPSEFSGKYMGFTVDNTSYTNPITDVTVSTGLAHLAELGITHVHLLPTYDADWNDESNFQFNWGYNPQHYNSPEGGYSTDPYDGAVRVNEYKQMVMAMHNEGINVINDVVYNHTGPGDYYSFNRVVPGYFYRYNADGSHSNGSGVGNETASERFMVNKFMVDSVAYWAEEYHIDGFRFDLMAVHDYGTMNDIADTVEAMDPDIFIYGEPWGGGDIKLPSSEKADSGNLYKMPLISVFNDTFRDGVAGRDAFGANDPGYVTDGLDIYNLMDSIAGKQRGTSPLQTINYVSAHDNKTLYDKLIQFNGYSDFGYHSDVDYQSRLANSIVLLSQGVPFLHAGSDFLRTKGGDHNSYESSDLVNQLSYARKSLYVETFEYYKGIIEIRKEFESFRMSSSSDVANNLTFLYPDGYGLVGYNLTKNDENILVYHNAGVTANDVNLPSGAWKLIADKDEAGLLDLGTYANTYPIAKAETLIFVEGNQEDVIDSPINSETPEITNSLSVMYEGGTFTLTSNVNIAEYSINAGDFVAVTTTTKQITFDDLEQGTYVFLVKDAGGQLSESFTLTVLEDPNPDPDPEPLVCEDYQIELNGECVDVPQPEPTCTDDQTLVDGECVDNEPDPEPVVCNDNEELVDGECVEKEVADTGCFGNVSFTSTITVIAVSLIGIIYFIRRKY